MNYFPPKFRSSTSTKYGYGQHALITVSDPSPVEFRQASRDMHVIVLQPIKMPDLKQTFTQDYFGELVDAGKVRVDPRHFDEAWQRVRRLNPDLEDGTALPADQAAHIEFYRRLVHRIEEMRIAKETSLTDKALKISIGKAYMEIFTALTANRQAQTKRRGLEQDIPRVPTPGTFRRYRRRLLELNGERLALRDRRHALSGNRTPRIEDPVVLALLRQFTRSYLDSNRPSMKTVYNQMKAHFGTLNDDRKANGQPELKLPSPSTLERSIRKLAKSEKILARYGEAALKKTLKVSGPQELATRAGERVPTDNWRTHLMTKEMPASFWAGVEEKWRDELGNVRLNFCLSICQATKVVLGIRISQNGDTTTTLRTLEMVCRDKTDIAIAAGCSSTWDHACTPEIVPFDNGSEIANAIMQNACRELGSEDEIGIAGEPNGRPVVERFFRTADIQFLPLFTGRTFSNVVERGDYESGKMASLFAKTLSDAFIRWVVDVYHNEPHAALGGETPNDAWARCNDEEGVCSPPTPDQMRAIFGFMDRRRIGNQGIRFMGLRYRSYALALLRAQIGQGDVIIKADLENLGAISVRSREAGSPWIVAECESEEFEGVSAERWIEVVKGLRARYAAQAKLREGIVLEALRALKRMGDEAAKAAGIGPTTLTDETIRKAEKKLFNAFVIELPSRRRKAAEEFVARRDAAPVAQPAVTSATDAGPETDGPQATGRRRGLGRGKFLKGA
ncbi:Mu transposase C-terminal domain-containing protein [uncultured Aureimonas sp.]|uniref:Mu transposase C-terminal domain-containing protein n=1 Tax=uncultured Aureimonas sp. TaxID=1604662 RepID=UPI0025EA6461|nr:Mu transposase C-terminal domain-containing protein [uncultured Aureimonas sp.]